ncbi:TlpA family protein disulfide reductase [Vulgatibacter sp.]|uniref:TlpA family protein disulfide reductase n=1 Tax=Vulgatibacter sp. TaxID=1971226 RepID=UPI0035677EBE
MHLYDSIPSFEGASSWSAGGPLEPEALRGRPTLIHIWSQACTACREQAPSLLRWAAEFGPQGLQIVGLHARSSPEQRDEEARRVAEEEGLRHPIAYDGVGAPITRRFGATFVPSYFLFDADGRLRHRQAGLRADVATEAAIRRVLEEERERAPTA